MILESLEDSEIEGRRTSATISGLESSTGICRLSRDVHPERSRGSRDESRRKYRQERILEMIIELETHLAKTSRH